MPPNIKSDTSFSLLSKIFDILVIFVERSVDKYYACGGHSKLKDLMLKKDKETKYLQKITAHEEFARDPQNNRLVS